MDQDKVLSADLAKRRESLVRRVKAGAKCEIGPWIPQLVRIEQRRFSAKEVARILGVEAMEAIRSQLTWSVAEIFGLIRREGWEDDSLSGD